MKTSTCLAVIGVAGLLSVIGMLVTASQGRSPLGAVQLTIAIIIATYAVQKLNRRAGAALFVAAAAVAINQLLLAFDYLTFLNAGLLAATSAWGSTIGTLVVGVVVAGMAVAAFYPVRPWWRYILLIVLVAGTWPTRFDVFI